jgi:hypothetical protein
MEQLEKFFEDLFIKKIPYQLPVKAREAIVEYAYIIIIIGLIFMVPAILAIFGLGSIFSFYALGFGSHFGLFYYLSVVLLIAQAILLGLSLAGLKARKIAGWRYVYYSELVSALHSIVFSYGMSGIFWSVVSIAIGLYLVFQVKSYYK